MALASPIATNFLNSPSHSKGHNVFNWDTAAPNNSIIVDSSGNVGIGTTSPTSLLHLSSTGDIFSTIDRGTTGHGGRLKFATAGVDEVEIGLSSLFGSNNFGISDGSANPKMVVNVSTGNVGIGITSPTAVLHLKAGTATANTASLKIDAGVVATTPVSGNIESDGTNLYWTDSGGTRRQLNNA